VRATAMVSIMGAVLASACARLPLRPQEVSDAVPEALQTQGLHWTNVPTRFVEAGGVRFAYRELGTHNQGVPVVFLVHLGAVLDNWDPRIINGLAAHHHVVAFDNRGVGASSGKPASSIEQMAQDAIGFIEAMGFRQVDLLGFSMGGMIAQDIALKRPRLVRKMILAGTGPAGGAGIANVPWVTYKDMLRGYLTFQDPKQFLFFTRSAIGIRAGREFLERIKLRTERRDEEISLRAFRAQLMAIQRWGTRAPQDLSLITQPVLVVNGDHDRMVPTKNTYDLARRLPHGELVIYPDAGHGAVFQFHADFVPRSLEFLAR
jgi:pimeloyl-ACP methyl ester carboxylesterase